MGVDEPGWRNLLIKEREVHPQSRLRGPGVTRSCRNFVPSGAWQMGGEVSGGARGGTGVPLSLLGSEPHAPPALDNSDSPYSCYLLLRLVSL